MSLFDRWFNKSGSGGDSPALDIDEREATHALLERIQTLPHSSEPRRDLFLGVKNRIETDTARGLRARIEIPVWAVAVATAFVLAISVGVGTWMTTGPRLLEDPEAIRELASSLRDRDGVTVVRTSLLALLEERRDELPPDALSLLEENLAHIDRAIAEIHIAFEQNPENAALLSMLAAVYRSEVDMLEQFEKWTRTASTGEVRS